MSIILLISFSQNTLMEHYAWQLTHISYFMIRRICLFFMLLSPSNQKPEHFILLIICFLQNMFVEHYVKTAVPYFLFHDQNNMFVLCVINSIKSETWTFIHHFGLNHQTIEHTVCNAPSLSLEKYEQKLTVMSLTWNSTYHWRNVVRQSFMFSIITISLG